MIISYWCHVIEGLQVSPSDFYASLEASLERRRMPGTKCARVQLFEGGLLSAKREYVRVSREKLQYDVCAAPFGSGFFVSSRLTIPLSPWPLVILLLGVATVVAGLGWVIVSDMAQGGGSVAATLAAPVRYILCSLTFLGLVALAGYKIAVDLDKKIMKHRIAWYERIIRRHTYYRADLTVCFQKVVDAAVWEVIDQYCGDQHLKPLSEFERQPLAPQLSLH